MTILVRPRLRVALTIAALLLAGCGVNTSVPGGAPGGQAAQSAAQQTGAFGSGAQSVIEALKPPKKCKGQKTTSKDATIKETLETKGGSLCIPAFGDYGGDIDYPAVTNATSITLESSTTNVGGYPLLGPSSETPIFYLSIALGGSTTFGNKGGAGGGLESPNIVVGDKYSIYGQGTCFGVTENFSPYTTTAVSSKHGGEIGGLGTVLQGVSVPCAATGILEAYED